MDLLLLNVFKTNDDLKVSFRIHSLTCTLQVNTHPMWQFINFCELI